jgi:hypothetical protein
VVEFAARRVGGLADLLLLGGAAAFLVSPRFLFNSRRRGRFRLLQQSLDSCVNDPDHTSVTSPGYAIRRSIADSTSVTPAPAPFTAKDAINDQVPRKISISNHEQARGRTSRPREGKIISRRDHEQDGN